MRRNLTFLALGSLLALNTVSAIEEGFTPLFDGKTLSGWDGDPRLWSVRDGVIHGETTPEAKANGNTFLIWQGGELADFELRFTFRCQAPHNSGVQYRSAHITEQARNRWVVRGYQHEVRNQDALPSVAGFIYDEGGTLGRRGRLCLVGEKAVWGPDSKKQVLGTLITAAEYKDLFKLNAWNEAAIRCQGHHLQHILNGRLILDCTDNHPQARLQGIVALQLHAGAPMWAEFKDIRLHRLP